MKIIKIYLAFFMVYASLLNAPMSYAQAEKIGAAQGEVKQTIIPSEIIVKASIVGLTHLISDDMEISLWGVSELPSSDVIFDLQAKSDLEEKIGSGKIRCFIKQYDPVPAKGRCANYMDEDLGLFLLQRGYVTADRGTIFGSAYDQPYREAEKQARDNNVGIWANQNSLSSMGNGELRSQNFLIGSILLTGSFILALAVLGLVIMRGIGRIADIQNKSIDLASKEQTLKRKEKFILASMLDMEMKTNQSKIEAYITVYDEALQEFNNSDKGPRYKKSGDIIQKQPVLNRSVFDGNTNRLDLMGMKLSSNIVHYYARIKTVPDYVELTPDTPESEAREVIAKSLGSAKKLLKMSEDLSNQLVEYGLVKIVRS